MPADRDAAPRVEPQRSEPTRFKALGPAQLRRIADRYGLAPDVAETARLFSLVLPFRVNEYVLDELIDWSCVPDDPIFQLVFPQAGMLPERDVRRLAALAPAGGGRSVELDQLVQRIRAGLNPHPSGQLELNVPRDGSDVVPGLQHKYRETVLYFPSSGQTCHAYCTYCFRWPQFVGDADLRFATPTVDPLVGYLRRHPEVSDVLVTGGDPMIMSAAQLRRHVEPVLEVDSVRTIRIGTKSVAYWPQRFVTDADADDTLRLFEQVVASGRTLAIMAHFSHPRELEPDLARRALERIRATGAVVYCQAPLMAHVNDDGEVWAAMWRTQLALGLVPYYLFVARDTGAQDYFKVPLGRAYEIFRHAYQELPGLARTVRGPVMSATPGKVVVDGVTESAGQRRFQLRLLNARERSLIGRPFSAQWSPDAAWLDELRPDASVPADIVDAVWPRAALAQTPA